MTFFRYRLVPTLVVVVVIILIVIGLQNNRLRKKRESTCPGYLDPSTSRPCGVWLFDRLFSHQGRDGSHETRICSLLKTTITTEWKTILDRFFELFKQDMNRISFQQHNVDLTKASNLSLSWVTLPFYFCSPLLMNLLPNDFAQNRLTPYGLVSGGIPSLLTIPLTTRHKYIDMLRQCQESRHPLHSILTSLDEFTVSPLPEIPFAYKRPSSFSTLYDEFNYDMFGVLGANTLSPNDGYIVTGILPMHELQPRYWSFVFYLADRYKSNVQCKPYQNSYFASILPPFNMFSLPPSKQNTSITFAILIARNEFIMSKLRHVLNTSRYDIIHEFAVPELSFPVNPSAPNPNALTTYNSIFNTETDRWTILCRIVPKDPTSIFYQQFLKNPPIYVYRFRDTTWSVQMNTYLQPMLPYRYKNTFPPVLPPLSFYPPTFWSKIIQQIETALSTVCVSTRQEQVYPSITSAFAPFDKKVLSGTFPYENGLLAIQCAGCALGDNPDCWYKFSKSFCLSSLNDVALTVAVNHAGMNNALYCNMNVNNREKSSSLHQQSFYRHEQGPQFYILVIGRSSDVIRKVTTILSSSLKIVGLRIDEFLVPTGASTDGKIERDHHLMFVERTYINPSLFWNGEQRPFEDVPSEFHRNLTHPDGNQLLSPVVWTCRV